MATVSAAIWDCTARSITAAKGVWMLHLLLYRYALRLRGFGRIGSGDGRVTAAVSQIMVIYFYRLVVGEFELSSWVLCQKGKGAWVVCCESWRACEEADKVSTEGILWDRRTGAVFKIEALIWVSFWSALKFSFSVEGLGRIQDTNPRT
jgi:hypothetical protein